MTHHYAVLTMTNDPQVYMGIFKGVKPDGLRVSCINDAAPLRDKAFSQKFDLIIVDLTTLSENPVAICQTIRRHNGLATVLLLAPPETSLECVVSLEVGADDYITMPVSMREFEARVKAAMRRADCFRRAKKPVSGQVLAFEKLCINGLKRCVTLGEREIALTPKEFDLLFFLAQNPGVVFTREDILRVVWGRDYSGYDHTVNTHVNRLRRKVEQVPSCPVFVQTVRGSGYRFVG